MSGSHVPLTGRSGRKTVDGRRELKHFSTVIYSLSDKKQVQG